MPLDGLVCKSVATLDEFGHESVFMSNRRHCSALTDLVSVCDVTRQKEKTQPTTIREARQYTVEKARGKTCKQVYWRK